MGKETKTATMTVTEFENAQLTFLNIQHLLSAVKAVGNNSAVRNNLLYAQQNAILQQHIYQAMQVCDRAIEELLKKSEW